MPVLDPRYAWMAEAAMRGKRAVPPAAASPEEPGVNSAPERSKLNGYEDFVVDWQISDHPASQQGSAA